MCGRGWMHQRRVFYYATDDYGYAHAHSAAAVAANYSRGYHTHDNGTDASGWKAWSEVGGVAVHAVTASDLRCCLAWRSAPGTSKTTWLMCHISIVVCPTSNHRNSHINKKNKFSSTQQHVDEIRYTAPAPRPRLNNPAPCTIALSWCILTFAIRMFTP